jgi:hypothetical protein
MIESASLKPYRPPPPPPPPNVSMTTGKPSPLLGPCPSSTFPADLRFIIWCGKVINWFGRILIWASQIIFRQAPRGHKFIAAHIFGPVQFRTLVRRELACSTCKHQRVEGNFESCAAENCGCGKWPPANLKHKRRLSGYRCVEGRFEYGLLARWYYRRKQKHHAPLQATEPSIPTPPHPKYPDELKSSDFLATAPPLDVIGPGALEQTGLEVTHHDPEKKKSGNKSVTTKKPKSRKRN